jgi:hypothetical protein
VRRGKEKSAIKDQGLETQKARFNGLGKKLHETLRFLPKNLRNP